MPDSQFPIILPVVQPLTIEQAESLRDALDASIKATREAEKRDASDRFAAMIAHDIAMLPNLDPQHLKQELESAEWFAQKYPDSTLYANLLAATREEIARRERENTTVPA